MVEYQFCFIVEKESQCILSEADPFLMLLTLYLYLAVLFSVACTTVLAWLYLYSLNILPQVLTLCWITVYLTQLKVCSQHCVSKVC